MLCISKSTLLSKNCTSIKTNSEISYKGNLVKSCSNANSLFEWSFMCAWKLSYFNNIELCANIYYLTINGYLFFLFFLLPFLLLPFFLFSLSFKIIFFFFFFF
jgi:hypothetical protein